METYDVVVHHGKCADGECAAWVVLLYHERNNLPTPVTVPCAANKASSLDLSTFEDKSVIFVDICPDLKTLMDLATVATRVKIIDHHKTNYEALENLPEMSKVKCVFDMNYSGCHLAWKEFNPDLAMPWFVSVIGMRDIWDFSQANTRELYLGMQEEGLINYQGFNAMLADKDGVLNTKALDTGRKTIEFQKRNLRTFTEMRTEWQYKDGARVWLVNCPDKALISDLGNDLLQVNFDDGGSPDFAVIWNYDIANDNFSLSMRSLDSRRDVSEICKKYGGGGHRNSAGCVCNDIRDLFVGKAGKVSKVDKVETESHELVRVKRMLEHMYQYLVDDYYVFITKHAEQAIKDLPDGHQFTHPIDLIMNPAFRTRVDHLHSFLGTDSNQYFINVVSEALDQIKREGHHKILTNLSSGKYQILYSR